MEFKIDLDNKELNEIASEIGKKKIMAFVSKELDSQLDTIKKNLRESISKGLQEALPDLEQKIEEATKTFLLNHKPRIADTLSKMIEQKFEHIRLFNGLGANILISNDYTFSNEDITIIEQFNNLATIDDNLGPASFEVANNFANLVKKLKERQKENY